ncbi:MAG: segregation/condensation protein A [Mycoplasmataceae bacterium]|nr:segregation/condensation protein A [Mycoplasmataceae bacterium]
MNQQPAILNLKLNTFDGPIDLLESLIREHKLDILNLDIAALASQYLNFIRSYIDQISIDDASEYLSMATYLLELKSKKVLPVENLDVNSSSFELERDRLVNRIIEYRKYKNTIPKLLHNQNRRLEMYAKQPDDLESYITEDTSIEQLPDNINPTRLMKAMEIAFEKWKLALFTHRKILVQELAVDDVEKDVLLFLDKHQNIEKISFSDFLKEVDELKLNQQYIVTCFSALLELVKYRKINLNQNDMDDDIWISKNTQKDEMQDSLILN